jgi:hypothetical protein
LVSLQQLAQVIPFPPASSWLVPLSGPFQRSTTVSFGFLCCTSVIWDAAAAAALVAAAASRAAQPASHSLSLALAFAAYATLLLLAAAAAPAGFRWRALRHAGAARAVAPLATPVILRRCVAAWGARWRRARSVHALYASSVHMESSRDMDERTSSSAPFQSSSQRLQGHGGLAIWRRLAGGEGNGGRAVAAKAGTPPTATNSAGVPAVEAVLAAQWQQHGFCVARTPPQRCAAATHAWAKEPAIRRKSLSPTTSPTPMGSVAEH